MERSKQTKLESVGLEIYEFPFIKMEQMILDQIEMYCRKNAWELAEIISVEFDKGEMNLFRTGIDPYIKVTFERYIVG